MKDVFPENLGQNCGYALYQGVHYTRRIVSLRCLGDARRLLTTDQMGSTQDNLGQSFHLKICNLSPHLQSCLHHVM